VTDYTRQIERIESARSLDDIRGVARSFPAKAQSEGGILYTGKVGNVDANVIAKELAHKTGLPIIDDTPRAIFLSDEDVKKAITKSAERIFKEQKMPLAQIEKARGDFLYGDGKAVSTSPLSVKNSLWGEASAEFAGSVHGHVTVVASAANAERVLAQVELPTTLQANRVTTLAGHPLAHVQELHTRGGIQASLPEVQAQFIDASTKGIFIEPAMVGKPVTEVAVSREAAMALHLDGSKFVGAKALSEAGFVPAPITPSAPPGLTAASRGLASEPLAVAEAAGRGVNPALARGLGVVGGAAMAYDAYQTAEQYQALSARGNQFGADALLHHYEGRTAGGLIGGFAAGAAYGAVAGSESGPGALVTGAVGGVVGAFAGDKIATAYNEHQVNHQTGTDGVTYAYDKGQWTHTSHSLGLGSYDLPTIKETTTHAPAAQLSTLDYQRTTAVTALAMANLGTQDTKHITLDNTEWRATHDGWAKRVEMQGVQTNSFGIPSSATVSEPADAKTSAQLNQIAANRQFNNDHYAENVSKAYVMDYYGKGWDKNGPLPDAVTHELKRPSEQQIKDPTSGHTWTADGKGQFSREETTMGYDTPVTMKVKATGAELAHVEKLQQAAIHANAVYGSQLIAEKYAQLQPTLNHQQAPVPHTPTAPQHSNAHPASAPAPHAGAEKAHAPAHVQSAAPPPSAFFHLMSAKIDRVDKAMQAGDHAAVNKEVGHVYQTPEWQANYGHAREVVAKEQQQREQQRAQNPRDPRDATHPDHAMNQSIRKHVETLHERAGHFVSNKELDHLTASVANDARTQGMKRVDEVQFSGDKNTLLATQNSGIHEMFAKHSVTNIQQAMQTPPEHAYQQMGQETQRQAQIQQNIQQQIVQPQQQGPSLGR
jgi:hypothetical protein